VERNHSHRWLGRRAGIHTPSPATRRTAEPRRLEGLQHNGGERRKGLSPQASRTATGHGGPVLWARRLNADRSGHSWTPYV